ncbi:MAG: 50S ribosomal protein L30 [Eubacteriales bacterium]|jgi:large subunit ribosomal protein L30|nr:50S ribosomal protein L30 [Eubacteriales bacterium]NCC81102.1 50S ribosomal protein L30 [Clostridia bacterium]
MGKIKVTLVKSTIGRGPKQMATAQTLGLTKLNKTVIKEDNEAIRGMVKTIGHLVKVEEV